MTHREKAARKFFQFYTHGVTLSPFQKAQQSQLESEKRLALKDDRSLDSNAVFERVLSLCMILLTRPKHAIGLAYAAQGDDSVKGHLEGFSIVHKHHGSRISRTQTKKHVRLACLAALPQDLSNAECASHLTEFERKWLPFELWDEMPNNANKRRRPKIDERTILDYRKELPKWQEFPLSGFYEMREDPLQSPSAPDSESKSGMALLVRDYRKTMEQLEAQLCATARGQRDLILRTLDGIGLSELGPIIRAESDSDSDTGDSSPASLWLKSYPDTAWIPSLREHLARRKPAASRSPGNGFSAKLLRDKSAKGRVQVKFKKEEDAFGQMILELKKVIRSCLDEIEVAQRGFLEAVNKQIARREAYYRDATQRCYRNMFDSAATRVAMSFAYLERYPEAFATITKEVLGSLSPDSIERMRMFCGSCRLELPDHLRPFAEIAAEDLEYRKVASLNDLKTPAPEGLPYWAVGKSSTRHLATVETTATHP